MRRSPFETKNKIPLSLPFLPIPQVLNNSVVNALGVEEGLVVGTVTTVISVPFSCSKLEII